MAQTTEPIFTVKDLVERWGCSERVAYKFASEGKGGVRLEIVPGRDGFFFTESAVRAFEDAVVYNQHGALLTATDLAERWRCHLSTVYRYIKQGKRGVRLQPVPNPKGLYFRESKVVEFERAIMPG